MTTKENFKEKLKQLIEPLVLKKNMELVNLEWRRERTGWVLRLFIDKPGGVTIGDCTKISEMVGKILDRENLISHSYHLEVSSPGIERPLVKKEDYERFKGERIKVTLKNPISGRKNFTGILLGIDGNLIKIRVEEKDLEISLENIKKANLKPEISFK